MRILLFILLSCCCLTITARNLPDSVVMIVGDKQITEKEFLYSARKTPSVDLSNNKSLNEFVELFENFQLKLVDAKNAGIDETPEFRKELAVYKLQLRADFLKNEKAEEDYARVIYDRFCESLSVKFLHFPIKGKYLSKDTLDVYNNAQETYQRIKNGESLEIIGKELEEKNEGTVYFREIRHYKPLTNLKVFEDNIYNLKEGDVSLPFRADNGYYIVELETRKPNPGQIQVAHILLANPLDTIADVSKRDSLNNLVKIVHEKAVAGEDFANLAKTYSIDKLNSEHAGLLPLFSLGEFVEPFEKAAFALKEIGQISEPTLTKYGYHIIILVDQKGQPSFQDSKKKIISELGQKEYNFALKKVHDEKLLKDYGYIFYPEAYDELVELSNKHHASYMSFYENAESMKKILFHLDGIDYPQSDFAYYIQRRPYSAKQHSTTFMNEIFSLYLRDILMLAEKKQLLEKYPEIELLSNEYRDGLLLYEISNKRIWSQPADQQKVLEEDWIAELRKKYPIFVNKKLLRKLRKQI